MLKHCLFAATLLGFAALAACSSSSSSSTSSSSSGSSGDGGGSSGTSGSSGCQAYDPGSIDLQNPKVSFKTDVVAGVFNKSCGLSTSCHGSPTTSQTGLFLGAKDQAGADSSTVQKAIVGVVAQEDATIKIITAGDPKNSYLMHKMDADQCTLNAACTGGDCLSSMPQGSDPLPPASRDVVRRWIAQGALEN